LPRPAGAVHYAPELPAEMQEGSPGEGRREGKGKGVTEDREVSKLGVGRKREED